MKTPNSRHNPSTSTANRRFAKAVGLSLALHVPLILNNRICEVWDERENIVYVVKERTKSVLNSHPREKSQYIAQLKEALERDEPIDLGEFYLKTQYLEGRLDEDSMKQALEKLASVESELRAEKESSDMVEILDAITAREGSPSRFHSYLSSPLLEGRGDCHARERFTASLIHRLFPDMEMIYQIVKVDEEMHTRTLVKVDGEWRNMEDPSGPVLTEADLDNTVIYRKYDYVRYYVGQDNLGGFKGDSSTAKESYTKLLISDDYLGMPLPDKIDSNIVKDISADNSVRAAGGSVSTLANSGGREQVGSNRDPIPVTVFYEPDFLEVTRRQTEKTLSDLREFNDFSSTERKDFLRNWLPSMPEPCFTYFTDLLNYVSKQLIRECHMGSVGELQCASREDIFHFNSPDSYYSRMSAKLDDNPVCDAYVLKSTELKHFSKYSESTFGIKF